MSKETGKGQEKREWKVRFSGSLENPPHPHKESPEGSGCDVKCQVQPSSPLTVMAT